MRDNEGLSRWHHTPHFPYVQHPSIPLHPAVPRAGCWSGDPAACLCRVVEVTRVQGPGKQPHSPAFAEQLRATPQRLVCPGLISQGSRSPLWGSSLGGCGGRWGGCGSLGAMKAAETRVYHPGRNPPRRWCSGDGCPPGGTCVGCRYGCMRMCRWVLPRACPRAPSPRCPRVQSRGHFSAPLATAMPARNDMVIASGGPATRAARLAGQPLAHPG